MFKTGNIKWRIRAVFAFAFCVFLVIIVVVARSGETEGEPTVRFVTSSEANNKINEHQDAFILDVRSSHEFFASRIPGSVNNPYAMIDDNQDLLPSGRQTLIFVYCRTGRRAGIAANRLLELGYTNIIVFPGMITWVYETVSG